MKFRFSIIASWFAVLLLCISISSAQELSVDLNTGWKLEVAKNKQIHAVVPGYVHTDLLAAGIIRDPYYADHETESAWVARKEWKYSLTFDAGAVVKKRRCEILFEGLDTYAEVFLNGRKVLTANNQFVPWRIDVTGKLKEKGNHLQVVFKPFYLVEDSLHKAYGLALPGGSRVFTRKGQWQYGWDWAPALPSMGIWKGVKLMGYDKAVLRDVQFRQSFADHKLTGLEAIFRIEVFETTRAGIAVNHPSLHHTEGLLDIEPGLHELIVPLFFKDDVRYWWPVGMGEQYLYEFECVVRGAEAEILDRRSIRTGIREVELIREPDRLGETFYFRINGLPVFARGANWVPLDHFPTRAGYQDYKRMIDEALFANMNMLRVWGGGIYEDDRFYALCDEMGIMVWQDFMFACAMYPGNEAMLGNIRQEATHQVERLAKHPSVVLWCGNNEVSEGWHRWGWPADYNKADSGRIWNDYLAIFGELLPGIVDRHAPGIPYWASSPSLGRGDPGHIYRGDAHYWGVWHDAEPFEMFRRKVPRFMSEFGFQSYPMIPSISRFAPTEAWKPDSDIMLVHQKHPRGNQLISQYMKDWFPEPENFEQYVYYSQLMQAEGMATGILAHREAKPWCMGTLYWQLNDCWPAVSWSSVDYYGERKALHYKAREVLEPVIAIVSYKGSFAELTLINDDPKIEQLGLFFQLIDHKGQEVYGAYYPDFSAPYNVNSTIRVTIPEEVMVAYKENKLLTRITLSTDYSFISQRIILPDKPKNIVFEKPDIRHKIDKQGDDFRITFWADAFVYGMYLSAPGVKGQFSDNFFNITPGQLKIIRFVPEQNTETLNVEYLYYQKD
jgi:beta-mannosidase